MFTFWSQEQLVLSPGHFSLLESVTLMFAEGHATRVLTSLRVRVSSRGSTLYCPRTSGLEAQTGLLPPGAGGG